MENTKRTFEHVLPVGYVLAGEKNTYVIDGVLGKGGFGVTYRVKARMLYGSITIEAFFALKEYFPSTCWRGNDNATMLVPPTKQEEIGNGLNDFINEGYRLQQVSRLSPNIVSVDEVFQANGTAYYILEYLSGGDLRKQIKDNGGAGLSEQQMLNLMLPVGRALKCLHDHSMLHLDVKPDNIVMRVNSDGTYDPVLIDFGLATHFDTYGRPTTRTPSLGVSPGYSPIEQYAHLPVFDPRLDVYAFSATCLYLLTGHDPVETMRVPAGYVRSVLPAGISENVVSAIEQGMSVNIDNRIGSIQDMMNYLESGNNVGTSSYFMGSPYAEENSEVIEGPYIMEDQDVVEGQEYVRGQEYVENRAYAEDQKFQTPKKSSKKIFMYVGAFLCTLLVVVGAILLFGKKSSSASSSQAVETYSGPTGDSKVDARAYVEWALSIMENVNSKEDVDNALEKANKMEKDILEFYYNNYGQEGEDEIDKEVVNLLKGEYKDRVNRVEEKMKRYSK